MRLTSNIASFVLRMKYLQRRNTRTLWLCTYYTLVLYTNHLPKVGAIDEGTWRRLIVSLEAKIEGKSDIKNYADLLKRPVERFLMDN